MNNTGTAAILCLAVAAQLEGTVCGNQPPPVEKTSLTALVERLGEHFGKEGREKGDLFLRYGLMASRSGRWVRIWAAPIDLAPDAPVEFLLIGPESGHDYEALARSFARAEDVHAALEFIGVPAGRPVDYRSLCLWPKGERVRVTYRWSDDNRVYFADLFTNQVRAETLLRDTGTGRHLPLQDFAFVGSRWLPDPAEATGRVYAADAFDPQAIISDYNEPLTVLDVPYRAVDSEVYGTRVVNPDARLPADRLLDILLEPTWEMEGRRVVDLTLQVVPGDQDLGLAGLSYRVTGVTFGRFPEVSTLTDLLALFDKLESAGHDLYLTVQPSHSLPIGLVSRFYVFLWGLTGSHRLRLEAPLPGDLFWKAFMPPRRLMEHSSRIVQPWELYLGYGRDGGVTGSLQRIVEDWGEAGMDAEPRLSTNRFPVTAEGHIAEIMKSDPSACALVLVYCPEEMEYGEILGFISPILADRPTVYLVPHPGERREPSE
ncbi:MAG TPA: hypothetical protein EYP62_05485 [Kiritimatiellae bacterium]|nr:hypothetical protein [Kiritimatiellia bacterium]